LVNERKNPIEDEEETRPQHRTYLLPLPRNCLRCGEVCYAYSIYDSTTTGTDYLDGIHKCYWACSNVSCRNSFQTMERTADFVRVDEVPENSNPYKGIAFLATE
jgi:hypothetical protein